MKEERYSKEWRKLLSFVKKKLEKNTNGVGNVDFRYTDVDGVLLLLFIFIIYPCRCILTKKKCGCSYWQIKVKFSLKKKN